MYAYSVCVTETEQEGDYLDENGEKWEKQFPLYPITEHAVNNNTHNYGYCVKKKFEITSYSPWFAFLLKKILWGLRKMKRNEKGK